MNWVRSALTDETGAYDVAYVSLFGVGGTIMAAVPFMCLMSAWAYHRCVPLVKPDTVVNCTFDPQQLGTGIGLACGGFATAMAALAAYMAATRNQRVTVTTSDTRTTINAPPVADDGDHH